MSITTAIQNAKTKIEAAYSACDGKGATMPVSANQNLSNLATTIDSIQTDVPGTKCIQTWTKVETTDETTGVTTVTYERQEEYVGDNYILPQWKYDGNTDLVAVLLPSDTKPGFNSWTFNNCANLKYINLENMDVNNIGGAWGNLGLSELNMPKLTGSFDLRLGGSAIYEIKSLGNITKINSAQGAFIDCKNLRTATLPDTLTDSGPRTFEQCDNLETVVFNNVQIIGSRCFYGCDKINIELPTTITTISDQGFAYSYMPLEELNLPNLTSIGAYAFAECQIVKIVNLGSITTLPNGGAGGGVFGGDVYTWTGPLVEAWLPATLTKIGNWCFAGQVNFVRCVCLATTPPTIDSTSFYRTPSTLKFYVPYSADHSVLSAYQAASVWSEYTSRIYELNQNGTIPA